MEYISIWAKRLTQQLILLVEKHQWMFAVVKIILLKIDIAQRNLRFLFNVAVHIALRKHWFVSTAKLRRGVSDHFFESTDKKKTGMITNNAMVICRKDKCCHSRC